MKNKTESITVRILKDLKKDVIRAARKNGESLSVFVREALQDRVKKVDVKPCHTAPVRIGIKVESLTKFDEWVDTVGIDSYVCDDLEFVPILRDEDIHKYVGLVRVHDPFNKK